MPPSPPPPPPPPPSWPARVVRKFSPPTVYLDSLASAGPNFFDRPPSPTLPPLDVGPKWYFFYGTLTDPRTLRRILNLPQDPILRAATVYGHSLALWGQYKALVDGETGETVHGFVYLVQSAEEEAKLERYETSAYGVRHCRMYLEDGEEPSTLRGYTFMYAGDAEALKEGRFDRKLWQMTSGVALPDIWHRDDTDKVKRR